MRSRSTLLLSAVLAVFSVFSGISGTLGCGTAEPAVRAAPTPTHSPSPSLSLSPLPSLSPSFSPPPSPSASPSQSPGAKGEGAVTVLALPGYAEWGGSDETVKWVIPFEARSGCKVTVRELTDDPAAKLADLLGNYDVVSAPPDLAGRIVAAKGAAVIDTSRIPSYDAIPKRLRPHLGSGDDETYAVPYLWSTDTIVYTGAPGDIFTSDGPVFYRDSPLTIGVAARSLKGVKNPFQLSRDQFDSAVALLSRDGQKRKFWRDPIAVVEAFAGGSARFAVASPYVRDLLNRGDTKVRTVPDRPVTGRVDSWVLAADAPHPACAYAWLAYASTAEVQGAAASWTGLAPANPGACKKGAERVCGDYRVSDLKGISFASLPAADCGGDEGECVDYQQWIDAWSRIAS